MPSPETIVKIGEYLLVGMTEREACVLAGFPYEDLQSSKETSSTLREELEKKAIEFKFNHLKEIQKSKSEKTSQWILEKLRPDDFGNKKGGGDGPTVNIISAIIKEIQNGDQGIVRINRGTKIRNANVIDPERKVAGVGLLN